MIYYSDGTKKPSWMVAQDETARHISYSDYSLKHGIVIAAYPPSSSQNRSKKFTEYDVQVTIMDGNTAPTTTTFYRLTIQSIFGGVADYSTWTPRLGEIGDDQTLGSRVLVLCANGHQRESYIIGGLRHPNATEIDPDFEDNHRYVWEFNGVNQSVNNDGDLTILHKGKTKDSGEVEDETNGNAYISLNSKGEIVLGYLDSVDTDYASIRLDKQSKTLNLFSKNKIYAKTEDAVEIETPVGVKINRNGSDQQAFVRGTTYRKEEELLHTKLKAALDSIQTATGQAAGGIGGAGASLSAAGAAMAVPVSGPMTASPLVVAAAQSLTAVSQNLLLIQSMVLEMITGIQAFEAKKAQYLSTHHSFGESP